MEAWLIVANYPDYDLPVAVKESEPGARSAVRVIQRDRKLRFRLLKRAQRAFQVRLPDFSPRFFSVVRITGSGCRRETEDET